MNELYLRCENDHWSFNFFPRIDIYLNPETGRIQRVKRDHDHKIDGVFVRHYLKFVMIYIDNDKVVIQIGSKKYSANESMECTIKPKGPFFHFTLIQNDVVLYKTIYWNPQIAILALYDPDFGVFGDEDVFRCIHNTVKAKSNEKIIWS